MILRYSASSNEIITREGYNCIPDFDVFIESLNV